MDVFNKDCECVTKCEPFENSRKLMLHPLHTAGRQKTKKVTNKEKIKLPVFLNEEDHAKVALKVTEAYPGSDCNERATGVKSEIWNHEKYQM